MLGESRAHIADLKINVRSMKQPVEMDQPTAALGVRESGMVLDLIRTVRARGTPVVLISHNMPQVFEIPDRLHVMRLGRRVATITPASHTMTEAVALMTGASSFQGTGG
jgi:fructose transport system ATP-binding protein